MNDPKEKFKNYPKTNQYKIIDTITFPHAYCITPKHIVHAADNFGGELGVDAIKSLEKNKGHGCCGVKKCNLSFDEHETALLVEVNYDKELKDAPGLQDYLTSCFVQMKIDNYCGFYFKQNKGNK